MSTEEKPKQVGRPAQYQNDKERALAKKRQDRKAAIRATLKRRRLYRDDPSYRLKVLAEQRKRYRRLKGSKPKQFGKNAGRAVDFSSVRQTSSGSVNALSYGEMGKFFGVTEKAFAMWVANGRIPSSDIKTVEGEAVYTVAQADAMAHAANIYLRGKATYRSNDRAAVKALHLAFNQNRTK